MNQFSLEKQSILLDKIILESVVEVTGINSLDPLLKALPGAPDTGGDFSTFQTSLEELYGTCGGHGVAQRSGKVIFHKLLRAYRDELDLQRMDFRLMPTRTRQRTGLDALARLLAGLTEAQIEREETADAWIWRVKGGSSCFSRCTSEPDCYFMVGILQEFLSWAGGGKYYRVTELECQGCGAETCLLRMEKTPLD